MSRGGTGLRPSPLVPAHVVDGVRAALFAAAIVGVFAALSALGIPARTRPQPAVARPAVPLP